MLTSSTLHPARSAGPKMPCLARLSKDTDHSGAPLIPVTFSTFGGTHSMASNFGVELNSVHYHS